MGIPESDISLRNSSARDKYEKLFKNRDALGNGSVDWAYLDSVWPVKPELFNAQDWKNTINWNHPYYLNVVHSILSNTHVLNTKRALSWYNDEEIEITPEAINYVFTLPNDQPDSIRLATKPTSWTLSRIDQVELFRVLAEKTLAIIEDFPKFIEWTVFAKMVHRVVCRILRPMDRRGYASKIDAWVAYHLMIRQPISLGHLCVL